MHSAHFNGKYEAELKYRLSSKSRFLHRLSAIPHEIMLENNTDTDCYFDTPDYSLKQQNKSLCIRSIEPAGINLWIVKGPGPDICEAIPITDNNRAKSMLATMGYQQVLCLTKTRSIYFLDQYHITVDRLEGLGDFAEFATMTNDGDRVAAYKEDLKSLASQFELTDAQLVTESYKTMATRFQQQTNQKAAVS